jgi:hypothetical protein
MDEVISGDEPKAIGIGPMSSTPPKLPPESPADRIVPKNTSTNPRKISKMPACMAF